jgi:transaldolase/glucose-6-phosphate isomerase
MNPLRALRDFGQSVWLDYIRRSLLTTGELRRLIDDDGLRGVTSNPAIFEKAIAGSTDYDEAFAAMGGERLDAKARYERIAVRDIQDAADVLKPVFEATHGRDGYVSLEVSPYLAHDTAGTLDEARRLWATVKRPNVMIKVPGTAEGVPAIRQLLAEGINVNVTLLFAREAYEHVVEAYLAGLEQRVAAGGDPRGVASVASFFVSRIDAAVDKVLDARIKASSSASERGRLEALLGKVAIANAKLAYERWGELFAGPRWEALRARGAETQRLLWASTSTKNPAYRDVLYVEELIGPETVDTIPPATFDAFRDHGRPRQSLAEDVEAAHETMDALARAGVSIEDVTAKLLEDGVKLFAEAFDKLLAAVEQKSRGAARPAIARQIRALPAILESGVAASLRTWSQEGRARRLWARDASLWTGRSEGRWLGWLTIADEQLARLDRLESFAQEVRREGFEHVLLLGMGGASLAADVLGAVLGSGAGGPSLRVLDTTHPAEIEAAAREAAPRKTLHVVASKSGASLESELLREYFFARAEQALGAGAAGQTFVAITDPGSRLEHLAKGDGFRQVFFGEPSIGGRFSALSDFGMVPAAATGLDLRRLFDRVEEMVHACSSSVPAEENPGVVLGNVLGVLGAAGRDKVTLVASPAIAPLGGWIEQLLANSTGKDGRGLVPVAGETLGPPEVYGADRLFVQLRLESAPDGAADAALAALERAGHPVVRIAVADPWDVGQEFFRWQIATAVAGAVLGVDPFGQPEVEASKLGARKLAAAWERAGGRPAETPLVEEGGVAVHASPADATALGGAGGRPSLVGCLRAHLGRLGAGDYLGLLAWVERSAAHAKVLEAVRHAVRDRRRVATCLGFGPRYLHATGQLHKGGPATGVFIVLTADPAADVPVPGRGYTFGALHAAAARADAARLAERGRRVLRLHLGADAAAGLARVEAAVGEALG